MFNDHLKRLGIRFRIENVVIVTDVCVPVCLIFVASLGEKFNFCEPNADSKLFDFVVIFEKLKDRTNEFFGMPKVTCDLERFKSRFVNKSFRDRANSPSKAQRFIHLQMKLEKAFLSRNPGVKVIPVDKGGKIIITDESVYRNKMETFISENVLKGMYLRLEGIDFGYVQVHPF